MTADPCLYPGSEVLRNLPGIRDQTALDKFERVAVALRMEQGVPTGQFDLNHLKTIHRHLFQDVYPWAGQIRSVHLSKGGSVFLPPRFIETGMQDISSRLQSRNHLQGMDRRTFVAHASVIIGDLNHIHLFREGNGRTQMHYLLQLAQQAGHPLDVRRIEPERWINASITANRGDYSGMAHTLHQSAAAWERVREVRQLRQRDSAKDRGR